MNVIRNALTINLVDIVIVTLTNTKTLNPLMGTLKPHNKHHYTAIIGTLADDRWAATFGTARRGLGGLRLRPPSSLLAVTKYNSPPINGQCTNFILFDVAL